MPHDETKKGQDACDLDQQAADIDVLLATITSEQISNATEAVIFSPHIKAEDIKISNTASVGTAKLATIILNGPKKSSSNLVCPAASEISTQTCEISIQTDNIEKENGKLSRHQSALSRIKTAVKSAFLGKTDKQDTVKKAKGKDKSVKKKKKSRGKKKQKKVKKASGEDRDARASSESKTNLDDGRKPVEETKKSIKEKKKQKKQKKVKKDSGKGRDAQASSESQTNLDDGRKPAEETKKSRKEKKKQKKQEKVKKDSGKDRDAKASSESQTKLNKDWKPGEEMKKSRKEKKKQKRQEKVKKDTEKDKDAQALSKSQTNSEESKKPAIDMKNSRTDKKKQKKQVKVKRASGKDKNAQASSKTKTNDETLKASTYSFPQQKPDSPARAAMKSHHQDSSHSGDSVPAETKNPFLDPTTVTNQPTKSCESSTLKSNSSSRLKPEHMTFKAPQDVASSPSVKPKIAKASTMESKNTDTVNLGNISSIGRAKTIPYSTGKITPELTSGLPVAKTPHSNPLDHSDNQNTGPCSSDESQCTRKDLTRRNTPSKIPTLGTKMKDGSPCSRFRKSQRQEHMEKSFKDSNSSNGGFQQPIK
ncbi:triadin-like [Acanthaster planci]|uniref:Triadin-like n=1 Tax=Acanthaster planci TaxID=133434 RepID=A0A8B7ZJ33_ACAPL|nr:triadin-like [Acanthaster planci]